jgi:predicted ATPase
LPAPVATDGHLLAPEDGAFYSHSLVGRVAELKALEGAFDAAISGRSAIMTVLGEPGIGKTALCEQVALYAGSCGGRVLVGHCYEEASLSLPYLPFVEAIRGYIGTKQPDALKAELGNAIDISRIVPELREIIRLELLPPGDPAEDLWRLLQAVTDFSSQGFAHTTAAPCARRPSLGRPGHARLACAPGAKPLG